VGVSGPGVEMAMDDLDLMGVEEEEPVEMVMMGRDG
jgi:hypothetical protein